MIETSCLISMACLLLRLLFTKWALRGVGLVTGVVFQSVLPLLGIFCSDGGFGNVFA